MTPEQMKQAHRRMVDALNRGAGNELTELFHDGYLVHEGFTNGDGTERAYPVTHDMLRQCGPIPGLPDKRQEIKMQIAEGDRVFTYCIASATHLGAWFGHPATGKRLNYENLYISRFHEGKIIEHWVFLDAFGMLRQIGTL